MADRNKEPKEMTKIIGTAKVQLNYIYCDSMDEALKQVGEYGRYQKSLNLLFLLIQLAMSMQMFVMIFCVVPSEWKCKENSTICLHNGTFTGDDERRCDFPRDSWTYTSPKDFSIITQFDIHCGRKYISELVVSIFFVGWGCGAVVIGTIADNFGRKRLILPCFFIIMLLGSVTPFLSNIWFLVVSRFIIGFLIQGTALQGMVIISEIVGVSHRPFATIIIFAACSIAWAILSCQAYLIQNWKYLSLVCTLPYTLLLPLMPYIPESLEWLAQQGKLKEVTEILKIIAKQNKEKNTENLNIIVAHNSKDTAPKGSSNPCHLFRTGRIAVGTLSIGYIWVVTVGCYNGMFMSANQLGGSIYRDFALLSLVDIPGIPLSTYICNAFGRRTCVLTPLLIGAVICIGTGFIPTGDCCRVYRVTSGIIANLFISLAYSGLYIWTVEIFPTNVRSTGVGFVMVCARLGTTSVPWLVRGLKNYGYWCSFVALGVPAIIGFFIGFVLPETKKKEPKIEDNAGYEKIDG